MSTKNDTITTADTAVIPALPALERLEVINAKYADKDILAFDMFSAKVFKVKSKSELVRGILNTFTVAQLEQCVNAGLDARRGLALTSHLDPIKLEALPLDEIYADGGTAKAADCGAARDITKAIRMYDKAIKLYRKAKRKAKKPDYSAQQTQLSGMLKGALRNAGRAASCSSCKGGICKGCTKGVKKTSKTDNESKTDSDNSIQA